ncbi:MAG: hypothetical protein CSA26_02025 [Desulfobacterales bacterium]|nr:MAG: hypothetical protein CSA26_02025 [Desulfobacterales bacterium]
MKNVRLSIKLIGGFCITALIVVSVGLIAMLQQNKLHHQTVQIAEKNLPAVENILRIKAEANYGTENGFASKSY